MKALSHASSMILSVALEAVVLVGAARAADPMDPRGLWLRRESGVQVSFFDCGTDRLCGKVVGAVNSADRLGIGTIILYDAKKVATNEWRGALYSIEDGRGYDGSVTVAASGAELSIKGCVKGFLCRSETWMRLPPSAREGSATQGTLATTLAAAK